MMDQQQKIQMARDIVTALNREDKGPVPRPDLLPAGASAVQAQRHYEATERYTEHLLAKDGQKLSPEERQFLARVAVESLRQ